MYVSLCKGRAVRHTVAQLCKFLLYSNWSVQYSPQRLGMERYVIYWFLSASPTLITSIVRYWCGVEPCKSFLDTTGLLGLIVRSNEPHTL